MKAFKNLLTEIDPNGLLSITINRPSKLNALNNETLDEIEYVFTTVLNMDEVRAVLITGAGHKSFVAGADISEIAELTDETSRKFVERGQSVLRLIEQSKKPVIAAVNGYALGGGCELAMACHIRIGSEAAVFGLPEVTLGIIPGYGGTQRLSQIVGKGKALELMMTGDSINAVEAYRIGLINMLVPADKLNLQCQQVVERILSRAPIAIAMVLRAVDTFYTNQEGFQSEIDGFVECCKSQDFIEGTTAFLTKHKPSFTGI
jgi:enoyl-CoA hydratase